MRTQSAAIFSRDIDEHPERYLAASLPDLPFGDRQFDVVVSSHFLFTYADRLDEEFHVAALIELHRVCSREVPVFPLLDQAGRRPSAMIEAVLSRLTRQGIEVRVQGVPSVPTRWQRDARHGGQKGERDA